jgi:hypothetical protein
VEALTLGVARGEVPAVAVAVVFRRDLQPPYPPIIADDWDYDPRRHTPSGIGTRTLVV